MMWKKILVAYDGSANADKALLQAIDIVEFCGCELKSIMVVEYPAGVELAPEDYIHSTTELYQEKYDVALEARPVRKEIPKLELMVGPPVEVILDYIEQNKIDLLVIGSSQKSLIDKFMLGSVSTIILKKSTCSVLVVR